MKCHVSSAYPYTEDHYGTRDVRTSSFWPGKLPSGYTTDTGRIQSRLLPSSGLSRTQTFKESCFRPCQVMYARNDKSALKGDRTWGSLPQGHACSVFTGEVTAISEISPPFWRQYPKCWGALHTPRLGSSKHAAKNVTRY